MLTNDHCKVFTRLRLMFFYFISPRFELVNYRRTRTSSSTSQNINTFLNSDIRIEKKSILHFLSDLFSNDTL